MKWIFESFPGVSKLYFPKMNFSIVSWFFGHLYNNFTSFYDNLNNFYEIFIIFGLFLKYFFQRFVNFKNIFDHFYDFFKS